MNHIPDLNHRLPVMIVLGLLSALTCVAQDPLFAQDSAKDGSALAMKYCGNCHGSGSEVIPGFDVLDPAGLASGGYAVAGALDDSMMWQMLESGEMPPENAPQPSAQEKETLRQWILDGAPKPARELRPHRFEEDVLQAIRDDLLVTNRLDLKYQRYFTFTHLYNNNDNVSQRDLRLYRAAFSKAINSLSVEPDIVIPREIDPGFQTIYRIDLRDLGWDKPGYWRKILKAYPYGLRFNRVADPNIRALADQVETLSATPLPYVRADWLTIAAVQPPLYHFLLQIPETDVELEKSLGVDVAANFLQGKVKRGGFEESGVSTFANRLVERHSSLSGYYWKSYDFRAGNVKARLTQYPLGPTFPQHNTDEFAQFKQFSFAHDGGEQVFSLPNGLQAYMLIDGDGNRIDEGPIDVVRDLTETAGKPVVVNGISCMHCHKHGMIPFTDAIRVGSSLTGDAREKVEQIYPLAEEMDSIIERDRQRFMRALQEATGPFLQVGDDKDKSIEQLPEPIGKIARFHFRDLGLEQAAYELGIADPDRLKTAIENNHELKRLGLGPLAVGRRIGRADWESRQFALTPFQKAAQILDRGTPLIFLAR